MENDAVKVDQFTEEELEQMLKEKKKKKLEAQKEARAEYEAKRDELVNRLAAGAKQLNEIMTNYKSTAFTELEDFKTTAAKYGDIRANSKGGFRLRNTDKTLMLELERNVKPEYDERASTAEELLKEFLEDKVKKKDLATFRTISTLLSRNKKGDFTPSQINRLLTIEDNYDDPRWEKAIQLFKESYQNIEVSMSISFYEKDEITQKDELIPLTFASLKLEDISKREETTEK